MSGFYVRDKYLWDRSRNGKWAGLESLIPGKVHYVAPTGAYASGFSVASARTWARENNQFVYDSINLAYADAVDGRGDVIALLPGTHTLTANLAWSKAGISLMGPEAWAGVPGKQRPMAKIVPASGSTGLTITAADTTLYGVECVPITAQTFASFSAAAVNLRVINCYLDMETPVVSSSTQGFVGTGAAKNVHVSGCTFYADGAQGFALGMVGVDPFLIEDCVFTVTAGTWATAIKTGAGSLGHVRRNYFGGSGTAITGVVSTGAAEATNAIRLNDNRVGVGHTLASGYGVSNGKCVLGLNYIETASGGTGGTLVTVTT